MVITRVAPSPTGFPHVGTAYQALFDYVWAKKNQGRFLLRLEDTDLKRFVPGSERVIYESLDWLGLAPDESPEKAGSSGPYRQSERLALYTKYARQLVEAGHAYYCFCSAERLTQLRTEQEKNHLPPRYDRLCSNISPEAAAARVAGGEQSVIRLRVPDNRTITVNDFLRGPVNFESAQIDDQVLLKSDGFPTYHLALVVDDHLMGITHVFRGEEWLPSAPKHVLLYEMLCWSEPVWIHLPLLKNPGGSKISKRQGHTSIFWYRDEGFLPEAVVNFLALVEWSPRGEKEVFSLAEMIKDFRLEDLRKAAAIFDLPKLYWLNGMYLRGMTNTDLYGRLVRFAKETDNKNLTAKLETHHELVLKILPLIKERIKTLKEFESWTDFFFGPVSLTPADFTGLVSFNKDSWTGLQAELIQCQWTKESMNDGVRAFIEKQSLPGKNFLMAVRLAITGKKISPPLWESMEILGKELCLARLKPVEEMIFN
ncbi:MAG: glutamate--tRNA ligase [Patescibacteria group bacterium]